ncbi:DUF6923 family protein [Haloferula sp.]|uniref:DUF6923 family protein n=1 Tax=Haloferula sp. TaxID=2497595 RepID=UPI00329FB912
MNTIHSSLLALLLFSTLTTAQAGRLIATSGITDSLYEIDPVTGTATLIGATGVNGASLALAADRDTCRVWSLEWRGSSAPGLYNVDTLSGAITSVGGNISYGHSGMAYDPNHEILFATDPDTDILYRLDPAKGMGTVIGLLPEGMRGLAYDPNHDILYGTSSTLDNLYSIDPATGASTLIGSLGFDPANMGLAYDWEQDILYLNDINTDSLYTLNTATGAATLVGANGANLNIQSLTYEPDPAPRRLLGISVSDDSSYHLSPSTGEAILIGEIGFATPSTFPAGLAADRVTGTVWAVLANDSNLYTMNPATGALTVVASGTAFSYPGLAYDPVNGVLYASSAGSADKLYSIDTTTAVATEIGSTPDNISGLAYDPDNGILYGTTGSSDELYTLNTTTGVGTLVGGLGFDASSIGLAYDWDRDILYLTEVITDSLYTLNTTTGAATLVGPSVAPNFQSLTYHVPPRTSPQAMLMGLSADDSISVIDTTTGVASNLTSKTATLSGRSLASDRDSGTVWALLEDDPALYSVDITTGELTPIASGTAFKYIGMAYDPKNEVLYVSDSDTDSLYRVNTTTAVATLIGSTTDGGPRSDNITGLAYDPENGILYGGSALTDSLYTVDTTDGSLTLIGAFGYNSATLGLAYDWVNSVLYLNDSSSESLHTVNTSTGVATLVGANGEVDINGLTMVTPCIIPRDLAITAATRSGSTMQIDFDGPFDRGFFDLKGSADLLSFPSDHTGISTFTEQGPGRYRFTLDTTTLPDDYFFRVEK